MNILQTFARSYRYPLLIIAAVLLSGCSSQEPPEDHSPGNIEPIAIDSTDIELFIDFEQGGLLMPGPIELLPNGNLAVLDLKHNEVLVYDQNGDQTMRFGGGGKGPGESVRPWALQKTEKHLNVVDVDQYKVNQFDYSGKYVSSFKYEPANFSRDNIVMREGEQHYLATHGHGGHLVKLIDPAEDSAQFFGKIMAQPTNSRDLEIHRKTLADGNIPAFHKNQVRMYYEGNHLYLFLTAYQRVQKYTATGELLWERDINLPVFNKIFDRVVQRAKEAQPHSVPIYEAITTLKVADGTIFLFTVPMEDAERKLILLDSEGNLQSIYHLPGKPMFYEHIYDPKTKTLYLTAPRMGQIYRTELPTL